MKLLLVDAGNARLKWALLDHNVLSTPQVANYSRDADRAVAELCAAVSDEVEEIAVSNVAGYEFQQRLYRALTTRHRRVVWFARSSAMAGGVRNAYSQPERLGVDRWAALVGAFARLRASALPTPLCVVDAGTALTIDALGNDGRHLGGLILPGLALQRTALLSSTADIEANVQAVNAPPRGLAVFATNTAQALAHSGAFACAAAIDRSAQELATDTGRPCVMLTGGDADAIAPWLATGFEICPNLVFEGLAILFEQRSLD